MSDKTGALDEGDFFHFKKSHASLHVATPKKS